MPSGIWDLSKTAPNIFTAYESPFASAYQMSAESSNVWLSYDSTKCSGPFFAEGDGKRCSTLFLWVELTELYQISDGKVKIKVSVDLYIALSWLSL